MSDRPLDVWTPVEPDPEDKSLGALFGDLSREFSELMRQEVALAKTELKDEASKAGKSAGMFGGAAMAGYMSLLLLSFAAAWGLSEVMPTGVAFLIMGVVYAVAALVLYTQGKSKARQINPVPEQTIDTLKEDVQWAKAQPK